MNFAAQKQVENSDPSPLPNTESIQGLTYDTDHFALTWHYTLQTFVAHTHTQPRNKNKSWLENGTRPLPGGSCGARWIDSALSQKAGVSGSLSGCVRS